jgi:chromate transporter
LFSFAAYLGAVVQPPPHGALGAAIALIAIFLPGLLLVIGAMESADPFWVPAQDIRMRQHFGLFAYSIA